MASRLTRIAWLVCALVAGLVIGFLDQSATEVQGSVLLILMASFFVAVMSDAPIILIGLAVGAGVPVVSFLPGGAVPNWGMLLPFIPALIGAAGGRMLGSLRTA